jgi:predicted ATP-grasp superfamily ATP-dependent carboligase
VASLAREITIHGNSPETLAKSKDWRFLRSVCEKNKITCPQTLLPGEAKNTTTREWLAKPAFGGGGRAVRPWHGEPLQKGEVAQALVKGRPASCAVLADGQDSVVLGITEQLIGRTVFGVGMFRWCGNIYPLALPADLNQELWKQVEEMALCLTRNLGLKGAFGLDLVITFQKQGVKAFLIEINPRPTASMELLEAQLGLNIFSLHQEALKGRLCPPQVKQPQKCAGKAVVFAGKDLVMPSTKAWRAKGRKDIPFGQEKVKAQAPICTVFAQASLRDECFGELCNQARRLRQEIADELKY